MNWIEEIGDLRFEFSDRDIFEHEDPAIRVLALQRYFFPQLGRLLAGATSLVREIYGDAAMRGLTRSERPRPKGSGYAVTEFNEVNLGLTGERQPGGLKFKKPNSEALQYGASRLWFEVHRIGTIRVVFRPLLYGVDAAAKEMVAQVFESSLGPLEVVTSSHFVTNTAAMGFGLLEEFAEDPSEMFTAGTYFPVDADSGLRRLAITFAALFPWFRAVTDLSLGEKSQIEKDVNSYMDWWEDTAPPYLYPEMAVGLAHPSAPSRRAKNSLTVQAPVAPVLRDRHRWRILQRDDWRCVACGKTSHDSVHLEIDHKVPRSLGGSDNDDNLQVLCSVCNSGKSNSGSHDLTRPARGSAKKYTES